MKILTEIQKKLTIKSEHTAEYGGFEGVFEMLLHSVLSRASYKLPFGTVHYFPFVFQESRVTQCCVVHNA